MVVGARAVLLCGAWLLVGVALAGGQAPPEQRVDIDELKAAVDADATMLVIDVREDSRSSPGRYRGRFTFRSSSWKTGCPTSPATCG